MSDSFQELKGFGIPLGVTPGNVYVPNFRNDLKKGQIICIASDGLWETTNADEEMFGKDRLKELIRSNTRHSAETIMAEILSELESFRTPARQTDDVTVVIIKVNKSI